MTCNCPSLLNGHLNSCPYAEHVKNLCSVDSELSEDRFDAKLLSPRFQNPNDKFLADQLITDHLNSGRSYQKNLKGHVQKFFKHQIVSFNDISKYSTSISFPTHQHQYQHPLPLYANQYLDGYFLRPLKPKKAFREESDFGKDSLQEMLNGRMELLRKNGAIPNPYSKLISEAGLDGKNATREDRIAYRRGAGYQNYINHLASYAEEIQKDLGRDKLAHAEKRLMWLNGAIMALECLTTSWKTEDELDGESDASNRAEI